MYGEGYSGAPRWGKACTTSSGLQTSYLRHRFALSAPDFPATVTLSAHEAPELSEVFSYFSQTFFLQRFL